MIKDNQKMLNRFHALLDACIIIITFILAYYLRFSSPFFKVELGYFYSLKKYMALLVYLVPMYLIIYYIFRVYTPKSGNKKWLEIINITLSNIVGIAFFVLILYFQKEFNISRIFFILFFFINLVLSVSSRMLFDYSLKVAHRKGYNYKSK